MVIQPIYNILFLPDVTYHFKKEFFTENASEQLEVGSELLFAFLRNEDDAEELDADHICHGLLQLQPHHPGLQLKPIVN